MAMDAAPMLKRKGAEAPEPWVDGVPVPATKIRRLDAVVPPVDPGAGAAVVQPAEAAGVPPPPQQPFEVKEMPMSGEVAPPVVVAPAAANDERAIVVYQPAEATRNLLRGPLRPEGPLHVSPDWIRGIKSTVLREGSNHRALFEALASRDENANLAMVPWAPAPAHFVEATATAAPSAPGTEMMDADQDAEGASMEVDQDAGGQAVPPASFALQGSAFHQQQQLPPQHCMAPQQQLQVPAAASYQPSPVTWSW